MKDLDGKISLILLKSFNRIIGTFTLSCDLIFADIELYKISTTDSIDLLQTIKFKGSDSICSAIFIGNILFIGHSFYGRISFFSRIPSP